MPYLPAAAWWSYSAPTPTDFYATNISGAQQLPNGNVLICDGPAGEFFEIKSSGTKVWDYINPVKNTGPMVQGTTPSQNLVFRCTQYADTFSGFTGHTLVAGSPIEINPLAYTCDLSTGIYQPTGVSHLKLFPLPANDQLSIDTDMPVSSIILKDMTGRKVIEYPAVQKTNTGYMLNISNVPGGIYFAVICSAGQQVVKKVSVIK